MILQEVQTFLSHTGSGLRGCSYTPSPPPATTTPFHISFSISSLNINISYLSPPPSSSLCAFVRARVFVWLMVRLSPMSLSSGCVTSSPYLNPFSSQRHPNMYTNTHPGKCSPCRCSDASFASALQEQECSTKCRLLFNCFVAQRM